MPSINKITGEIFYKDINYQIELNPFTTKGQLTVIINTNSINLWISFILTPLEKKFFSYKQLNFNYNNYIFTRNAEKKGKDEKEILLSRNIDRSIRPYIPEHFNYNISIESWNLSANDEDPTIGLLIGISCGLLSLSIIDHSIMPIIINNNFQLMTTVFDNKLSNLELSSKPTKVQDIINIIESSMGLYDDYNNQIKTIFNIENYKNLLKNYSLLETYNINETINNIEIFTNNYHTFQKQLKNIVDFIIKRVNDVTYNHFLHGSWDHFIHQWILDQLNQEKILAVNYFTEQIFIEVKKKLFCTNLIKNKIRQDGRSFDEGRKIMLETISLNNFHNSCQLIKGKTRLLIGGYFLPQDKNYDHKIHIKYIFNNFINPKRSSNRREIGHGNLIEKSINKIVNNNNWKGFFNCYIPNSDGSSSMLSVIGCGIMLEKFQWPIDKISGISIGLIENGKNKNFLVDIAENEDFYCSMDMKITSTKNGIVSCQLDVKNQGITIDLLKKAFLLGQKKNNEIIKYIYKDLNNITSSYYNNPEKISINCNNFFSINKN